MPHWFPRSYLGGALAAAYVVFAVCMVVSERRSRAGGWISLTGMATYLATFPISMPMELLGHRPDYKRNLDMGLTILACAAIVYAAGALIGFLAAWLKAHA